MSDSPSRDAKFMARALRLAERGMWTTSPNPRVGCVIVREERVLAEGWHQRAGEAHAEVCALHEAAGRSAGATAYVTLEPCDHQGRTGPCSRALIEAGVRRVVYAASAGGTDSAGGAQTLRQAGVEVLGGVLEGSARALNPGFHKRFDSGLPWVRVKLAQTLDGHTALPSGASRWITGPDARADVHRWRARSCAVLTGSGTVLADDPQLTARAEGVSRQPLRVVLDSSRRTPPGARVLDAAAETLLLGVPDAPGVDGRLDLEAVLRLLAGRGLNEILVEAGPTLSGAFFAAGLVDELIVYTAPSLFGAGRGLMALPELANPDAAPRLNIIEQRRVGVDWRIIAALQSSH